jgi:transcriptional regulator with XRE-family HTH domain
VHEAAFERYEEWDLTPVSMPPRSTLYTLEPMGLGTCRVESLTSYLTRLAATHCVFPGVLISKMMAPLVPGYLPLQKRPHGLFTEATGRSAMFDGVGLPARYAVEALEALTRRVGLSYLTCLPLSAVLPTRAKGLLRWRKAWCPVCYQEQRETAQLIYDPLLWAFQDVCVCTQHRLRLSSCCLYSDCGRPLPGVAWRAKVGYCSLCQRWLGLPLAQAQERSSAVQETEWRWQLWVTEALGTVLAIMPTRAVPLERERIRQVVRHVVQQTSAGEISEISAFARKIGLSRNMIDYWHQGKKVPEIGMLLQFCFRLGLSLEAFLFQEIDALHPTLKDPGSLLPVIPRKKPAIQAEHVYQVLELAAEGGEDPPPTLKRLAHDIGHTSQILYRLHPTACQKIVAQRKAYMQQHKEARLQKFRDEIKLIARQLHAHGERLTQKTIAPHLLQSGILRDPQIRRILQEICGEIESG